MADTSTSLFSLHHHCGQSMAGSDITPPASSRNGADNFDEISPVRPCTSTPTLVLPSTPARSLVLASTPPPPPVAADHRSGPIGGNADDRTASGPEQAPEEDPVQYDPVSNLARALDTGGSRKTRGFGWIRDKRVVL